MERKRITVKQFRAMGNTAAFEFWQHGQWPFDFAQCDVCLIAHARNLCRNVTHLKFSRAVNRVGAKIIYDQVYKSSGGLWLKNNASALFALRKKFDKLYRAPRR